MRFDRIMGLIIGLWACFFALSLALWLRVFIPAQLNYQLGEVSSLFFLAAAVVIGALFGMYGAWRDGTRVAEFLLGSAIHVVLVAVVFFGMAQTVFLRPLPISFVLAMTIAPLLQCACVGLGHLMFALWARRDRCSLRSFA